MKTGIQTKRYALIALLIVLFLLSVFIAFITYRYYDVVVKGILGIVLLYLSFFFVKHSKIDVSINTLLSTPKKAKILIFALISPIISYWSTMLVIEMILFFKK